jgi:hypothetical protein
MRGEIRLVTDAHARPRPRTAAVIVLAARPALPVVGPAPATGGSARHVDGLTSPARR